MEDAVDDDRLAGYVRGAQSLRVRHVLVAEEVEGADADAIGMAPAPRLNKSSESDNSPQPSNAELAAEMAEVYAMAILRDVPFTEILKGQNFDIAAGEGADAVASIQSKIDGAVKACAALGIDPDNVAKVSELRADLVTAMASVSTDDDSLTIEVRELVLHKRRKASRKS